MNEDVLIVDDSLTVRMDIAEALERGGLTSRLCASLGDARAVLDEASFALIILDVLLPDGDGIDLLRAIRASDTTSRTPVVLLSTEAEVRDRIRGMATGADEYVGKPYDTGYLVGRAQELVRHRRASSTSTAATVLLIDDSATLRAELGRALTGEGYRVVTAGSGEEGLRVAADVRPAAVIVDCELPGIDGLTVIRRIRLDAALRSTPCLLLTSADGHEIELRALDSGADAFVRKEGDREVILSRVATMIRSAGASRAASQTSSLLGPKKVLAVDDNPEFLDLLAAGMAGEGYAMIFARTGEEALELLEVQPVDCVLLDLTMPGIDGYETCRRIRATPGLRDTPVVILTGREDREAVLDALASGADDCISKSAHLSTVRARVAARIRRKHLEDEGRRAREELLARELQAAEARAARELVATRTALLDDLARKNEELEAFAYSVSHDLRAPLRAIHGFSTALLEDHGSELGPDARGYAERVCTAAQRMDRLIEDLLGLSRIGRTPLRRRRIDLGRIAREVVSELERGEPGRSVEVAIEEGLVADADPGLLRILLDNLLGNAWKFTARSTEQRIEVGAVADHDPPAFFVADSGAGFDMAHGSRLFAPFQRLHRGDVFPGTGIGLATVRRIVDRHGGRIWAEGAVGRGAKFVFTLSGRPSIDAVGDDGAPTTEDESP